MKYVANKAFLHDRLGRVEKGQEFEATESQLGSIRAFVSPVKAEKPADKPEKKTAAKKAD